MGSRRDLNNELKILLGTDQFHGDKTRCWFQPPESIKMEYPCIVYKREKPDVLRANNRLYHRTNHYGLTYMTFDPDDPLIEKIEDHFPMCSLERGYTHDGLNHYYYDLYY